MSKAFVYLKFDYPAVTDARGKVDPIRAMSNEFDCCAPAASSALRTWRGPDSSDHICYCS
jgi:hypothetical protein